MRKILIIDDLEINTKLVEKIIKHYNDTITNEDKILFKAVNSGILALNIIEKYSPDVILLDIMMPEMDGYAIIKELKSKALTKDIPVLFFTAIDDTETLNKAFKIGGVDYITKPFNEDELIARIKTHIDLKIARDRLKVQKKILEKQNKLLKEHKSQLEKLVDEKTAKLERTTLALVSALENANLMNDDDTGYHIKRVSLFSEILARGYGGDNEFVKKIKLYASLHDIGKVGLPDAILKKPLTAGRYTAEEFQKMTEHVTIGFNMIDCDEIDEMAKNIVLYHHEKWDGTGYRKGLKGEEIPLEARIVAMADVYDALISKRVYKPAFSQEKTEKIIREEGPGKHFDPEIVDVFFKNINKIIKVHEKFQ